tara:strand:- start:497 stop:1012 length:516 start_codon:yes stop_codon:yes gene_type:complete
MQENQSFKNAIDSAYIRYKNDKSASPMILYKELGKYADMVDAYQKNFSNVHVVLYDNFIENTTKEVKKVFDFLGVKDEKVNTKKLVNSGGKKWKSSFMKNVLMGNNLFKRIFKILFPTKFRFLVKETIKRIFTDKADDIDNDVRNELLLYFKSDIQKLEKLINKNLSAWKK